MSTSQKKKWLLHPSRFLPNFCFKEYIYGFWKLLNFSQMTSGIPTETIVKFLWFRGIFDVLHFYTTLWSFRTGDPAKPKEQKKKNKLYKENYFSPGPSHSLPPLENGAHVRKLEMTAKEQLTGKIKGFQAKWSKDTYQVLRRASLRRNPGVYRYSIGLPQTYFRHELLLIPRVVDTKVLRIPTENRLLVADTWRP